jgi:hypothetical protein
MATPVSRRVPSRHIIVVFGGKQRLQLFFFSGVDDSGSVDSQKLIRIQFSFPGCSLSLGNEPGFRVNQKGSLLVYSSMPET